MTDAGVYEHDAASLDIPRHIERLLERCIQLGGRTELAHHPRQDHAEHERRGYLLAPGAERRGAGRRRIDRPQLDEVETLGVSLEITGERGETDVWPCHGGDGVLREPGPDG